MDINERPQRETILQFLERWRDALDELAGRCSQCGHPLADARPGSSESEAVYVWCGLTGCTCAHHGKVTPERLHSNESGAGE